MHLVIQMLDVFQDNYQILERFDNKNAWLNDLTDFQHCKFTGVISIKRDILLIYLCHFGPFLISNQSGFLRQFGILLICYEVPFLKFLNL